MSGIRSKTKTFVFVHDEFEEEDALYEAENGEPPETPSRWIFRAEKLGEDDDAVQAMTTRVVVNALDRKRLRDAYKKGEDIEALVAANITQEQVTSTRVALLAHMTVRLEGEYFRVPADYELAPGIPSPLAGAIMPISPEWLGRLDGYILDEALRSMQKIWNGKSAAQREAQREALFRVDKPISGLSDAREARDAEDPDRSHVRPLWVDQGADGPAAD